MLESNNGKGRFALNLAAAFFLCVLLLVSCGKTANTPDKKITGAAVKWTHGENEYAGIVILQGDQPANTAVYRDSSVTVTSPEQIAGLTVTYAGESACASVGEVAFELPTGTGEELYRIIRALSAGEGSFTEQTCGDETAYTVAFENGVPKSASITWNGGEIAAEFTEVVCE